MKTYFSKMFICFFALLFIFSSVAFASNIEPRENEAVTTAENNQVVESFETNYEILYSDLYLFNNSVDIPQIVDGNVFVYGQNVNITGVIRGNLFVMANTLNISSEAIIQGSVFALSNSMKISGEVSDVYALSADFSLEENGTIYRNLYVFANSASLTGKITRDAYISSSNLSFGENATNVIGGNLNYTSNNEIELDEGIVGGEIVFNKVEDPEVNIGDVVLQIVSSIVSALLFTLVIIAISIWFAPDFRNKAKDIFITKGLKAFLNGLLVLFGGILASAIIALFTYGFGFGIGLFLIATIIMAYIVSSSIFSMAVGSLIAEKLKKKKNSIGMYILFTLLITLAIKLIAYIPYLGSLVKFIVSVIGLGILCLNAYKREPVK